ncbi:hypothetical protein [Campylobacter pinnipediorum]|uniref:hypothetical protein n=1 Tax=Campylobacter pinnipediorum TaxID=1965231 RepID=UPI0013016E0F|nr:hypothetical protein [Campylobacter pinnipediorum]
MIDTFISGFEKAFLIGLEVGFTLGIIFLIIGLSMRLTYEVFKFVYLKLRKRF